MFLAVSMKLSPLLELDPLAEIDHVRRGHLPAISNDVRVRVDAS
jgi:hypothetical protein